MSERIMVKSFYLLPTFVIKEYFGTYARACAETNMTREQLQPEIVTKIDGVEYLSEHISLKLEKLTGGRLKTRLIMVKKALKGYEEIDTRTYSANVPLTYRSLTPKAVKALRNRDKLFPVPQPSKHQKRGVDAELDKQKELLEFDL